jgi:ADP-ribosylglycohydrolase/fructose-1,6-bisphosphatase/inositol monophosphatase family enzyme
MRLDLSSALHAALAAAREAGDILRRDRQRPGGPRGHVDKAEADVEAEHAIRARLRAVGSHWNFLGEETGPTEGRAGAPWWLVDPNDGTRDYLLGRRGSAVSIALVVGGVPRLGVVFVFAYPDDAGDLFAWAEGCGPLRRNRDPVQTPLPETLAATDIVLVSSAGDSDPAGNLACVAPARYRTVPSIAHRLALVAAGEAAAAVSINSPVGWDYAGGQALLRGAGGTLVDERGREVSYSVSGRSQSAAVFGAHPGVGAELARRPWHQVGMKRDEGGNAAVPISLRPGAVVRDAGRLARAQGCLLGQLAGDSLGGLVEFRSADEVARVHPDGPRRLEDGGQWDILAGQPTDDSEMALALARAIVARDGFESGTVLQAYRDWVRSDPFDVGNTVRGALHHDPNPTSQANGSLMRVSPLAIFAHSLPPEAAGALAREDSALTHPHPACGDATAAFVVGVAHAVAHGDGADATWRAAVGWAQAAGAAPLVREALEAARSSPPVCDGGSQGWVKIALQNAFYELLHAPSLEKGVVATVRRGGDTDTNAAIAGALLGAVHGREAVPRQWRSMLLSCRPHPPHARRPRPAVYWPVDALELAERLLLAGATL